MHAIFDTYRRCFDFSGRSRRRTFWLFFLFAVLCALLLQLVDTAFGLRVMSGRVGVLEALFGLVTIVPALALKVRRLHDTGRSGWWILLQLVPLLGSLIVFVFLLQKGDGGYNRYGLVPSA